MGRLVYQVLVDRVDPRVPVDLLAHEVLLDRRETKVLLAHPAPRVQRETKERMATEATLETEDCLGLLGTKATMAQQDLLDSEDRRLAGNGCTSCVTMVTTTTVDIPQAGCTAVLANLCCHGNSMLSN